MAVRVSILAGGELDFCSGSHADKRRLMSLPWQVMCLLDKVCGNGVLLLHVDEIFGGQALVFCTCTSCVVCGWEVSVSTLSHCSCFTTYNHPELCV